MQRDGPAADMRRACSCHWLAAPAGCLSSTPPLVQTEQAWRAPRLEGSVRQKAAVRTPNFSAPHVSSLVFKVPISARRYFCFPGLSALNVSWCRVPGPSVLSRGC